MSVVKNAVVDEPRAPFPWFGGKRRAAQSVWSALGAVQHYIEPFCGSCAMLLARPSGQVPYATETVNDKDGMIVNTWRAIRYSPDNLAHELAMPVMECELHARLATTKERMTPDFVAWIEGDEKHFDTYLAANWLYCTCASVGNCFNHPGPWRRVGGRLVNVAGQASPADSRTGPGVTRERPHLGHGEQGINRRLPVIDTGRTDGSSNDGLLDKEANIRQYLRALAHRLERVRICCGDWRRVVDSETVLFAGRRNAGVFLDPPYLSGRYLYCEGQDVLGSVREWCLKWGRRKDVRIVLCGFDDDGHDILLEHGWSKVRGFAGSSGLNKDKTACKRERMWLSPQCDLCEPTLWETINQ